MAEKSSKAKKTTKPKTKTAKTTGAKDLPPVGSAARKAMILRGEIKE